MIDGSYLFGEFLSVVAGIGIGAAIVGVCWGAHRIIQLRDRDQPRLDAVLAEAKANTDLVKEAIDMVKRIRIDETK